MSQDKLNFITDMYVKNPKDSYLAFAAAVENQMAGNRKKAIQIIEDLIINDPNYTDAYFKLGKMYENSNKLKKAVNTYHAGKIVATKNNDEKSLGELTEALMFIDEEEGNY
jgi:tetratricopeptide (TPR) repeat protein